MPFSWNEARAKPKKTLEHEQVFYLGIARVIIIILATLVHKWEYVNTALPQTLRLFFFHGLESVFRSRADTLIRLGCPNHLCEWKLAG